MSLEKLTYEELVEYEKKLRTIRNDHKKCPAQREINGVNYCSFLFPCQEYAKEETIWAGKRAYCKCRYIEKEDSKILGERVESEKV